MNYREPVKANQPAASRVTSKGDCGCGGGCGSGCRDHHKPEACCGLTCFERPQYFCGQLLSDQDLTLQENYFREKNKLYHRTIDGFGVVCGLRMRCEPNCNGHILIGDGYAIDCCGNDLVVCSPRNYDVIGELRKRKWLIERGDECCGDENRDRDNCDIKQCFYIGICYAEERAEFVTPYTTDCSPAPGPCQPTRIHEGVKFEIYDKRPERPNPLLKMEKRIERCFSMFREGQFALGLEKLAPRILFILACNQDPATIQPNEAKESKKKAAGAARQQGGDTPGSLFAECRAQFLHELRSCPDPYNCNLEHEVCRLHPPADPNNPVGPTPQEAFTRLFELIQRHVFSCVLNELAFLCPDQPENCCVLIGGVEVENGKLTRVINYPRWYLWCFANFFEVLAYTIATEGACSPASAYNRIRGAQGEEAARKRYDGCCPTFEIDVCEFLNLFQIQHRTSEFMASSFIHAIRSMYESAILNFDFTKGGFTTRALKGAPLQDLPAIATHLKIPLPAQFSKNSVETADPFSAFLENLIYRGADPLVVERTVDGYVNRATPMGSAPTRAVGGVTYEDLSSRLLAVEEELRKTKGTQSDVPPTKEGPK